MNSSTRLKVAACVVFYNPEDCIYNNIESYIKNVDTLIIVDNSIKKNNSLLEKIKNEYKEKIHYIDNNGNLGIATALNQACDRAIELNYNWILTMDQDSCFLNFEDYLKCLDKLENKDEIALLTANTQWHAKEYIKENPKFDYEEKFLVITSGNLLNLKLFNKVGRFEDKLFIDMVDHEYCLKVNSHGYKILYFSDVLVEHSLGSLFYRKNIFTGKLRKKIEHNTQRVYYMTRNFLFLSKKYKKKFPKELNMLKTLNTLFIHDITKILIYEDKKFKKIYTKIIALYHFIRGAYGKFEIY